MRSSLRSVTAVSQPRNVGLISGAHGINEFFSIVLPPIIPLLVTELDITYAQAGFLLTVFFAMYSIFQFPAGLIADRIGKKRLLVGGLVGMSVGILLASTAQSYEMLILSQILAGVSGSTYHPSGMSLISDIETSATEGRAMGIFGFGGMVGTAAAPVIVGGLAVLFDWRVALAAAAASGLLGAIVFFRYFEDTTAGDDSTANRVQHDGGESEASRSSASDSAPPSVRERLGRLRNGSVRGGLARVRETVGIPLTASILLLVATTILVSLQTRAIMTFTTSYLFLYTGESTSLANLGFLAMLVAGSLSSLWAGGLADRFNRGRLGIVVTLTTGLLLGATLFVGPLSELVSQWPLYAILLGWFFVLGIAMYAVVPIKNAIISGVSEEEFSGSLFGVTQTGSAIGSTTGPALFGYLATEMSMAVAYPLIAIVSVLLALVFVALSRTVA